MDSRLLVRAFFLCACVSQTTKAFEYESFCLAQCAQGRGGNLCKCSAVHFAGKRSRSQWQLKYAQQAQVPSWRSEDPDAAPAWLDDGQKSGNDRREAGLGDRDSWPALQRSRLDLIPLKDALLLSLKR